MGAVNQTQLLPQDAPQPAPRHHPPHPQPRPRMRRRRRRKLPVILLILLLAWPVGLLVWANSKINHVDALSQAPSGDYTTYLLAGSDARHTEAASGEATQGARSDSIMLLTIPKGGASSLISIPRDTYVTIPGHGGNKINASYALGGPKLLVETVEGFTGMKVDHYAEIGMDGIADVVDAVGTVNLCMDLSVNDSKSKLEWEPGCHDVDGETALAFGRMRYQDPRGDLGRAERQRQLIQSITKEVAKPSSLNPARQVKLIDSGLGAIAVDEDSSIITMGKLAWAFRGATGPDGIRGTPPISSTNYQPGGVGSAVLITDEDAAWFFSKVADGSLTDDDVDD